MRRLKSSHQYLHLVTGGLRGHMYSLRRFDASRLFYPSTAEAEAAAAAEAGALELGLGADAVGRGRLRWAKLEQGIHFQPPPTDDDYDDSGLGDVFARFGGGSRILCNWVLPFSGKAEHVPELGLWFAMSRTSLSRSGLYALALSAAGAGAGAGDSASCQPPALYDIGVDLELRDDLFLFDHAVASLGSGRLCVARFFLIMKRENAFDNPIGVFTGVEVVPGDDGHLRVITHKSERFDKEFFRRRLL